MDAVILPVAFTDAIDAIESHRRAGQRVYLVSAAPEEVVAPLAARLGVDGAIASQAAVDANGIYTGRMDRYVYGPAKAEAVAEFARRDGIDLADSWAYSDSATDLPMLEAVGHPVAVNPDRALRRIAAERGWEIRRFKRLGLPLTADPSVDGVEAVEDVALPGRTGPPGGGGGRRRRRRGVRWGHRVALPTPPAGRRPLRETSGAAQWRRASCTIETGSVGLIPPGPAPKLRRAASWPRTTRHR